MLDWTEIMLRLGIATLAGGLIGLNRDLHGKPIGLKTLALVSLATAMLLVMVHSDDVKIVSDAGSRVIQGILTGIGFLGAGVIVHAGRHFRVRGLTSAACTWLAACIGIVCGLGQWRLVIVALVITFAVLTVGGRMERWLHNRLGGKDAAEQEPPSASSSDKYRNSRLFNRRVRTSLADRPRPCSWQSRAPSPWPCRNFPPHLCARFCGAGNPPTEIR